jgi:hypothetical protein
MNSNYKYQEMVEKIKKHVATLTRYGERQVGCPGHDNTIAYIVKQ